MDEQRYRELVRGLLGPFLVEALTAHEVELLEDRRKRATVLMKEALRAYTMVDMLCRHEFNGMEDSYWDNLKDELSCEVEASLAETASRLMSELTGVAQELVNEHPSMD